MISLLKSIAYTGTYRRPDRVDRRCGVAPRRGHSVPSGWLKVLPTFSVAISPTVPRGEITEAECTRCTPDGMSLQIPILAKYTPIDRNEEKKDERDKGFGSHCNRSAWDPSTSLGIA